MILLCANFIQARQRSAGMVSGVHYGKPGSIPVPLDVRDVADYAAIEVNGLPCNGEAETIVNGTALCRYCALRAAPYPKAMPSIDRLRDYRDSETA